MITKMLSNIALLTDGIYPYVMGGMQKHSFFLAKYFAQKKIHVDLYHYIPQTNIKTPLPFSDEEQKFINNIEIKYPKSAKFPGHYLHERYLYSKKIFEILKNRPLPDFIYAKGFAASALIKNGNKFKINTPIGVNFHGYEMFQRWPDLKTGIKLQILKRPVLKHIKDVDFLFSYGGKISEIIESQGGKKKIIEIPTGISSDWIKDKREIKVSKNRKFVFVGRAERRKGIQEINYVITHLKEKYNYEFHFIGPIDQSSRLNKTNCYYHGSIQDQNELKKLLDEMDILVCPSYSEGMPNVIMEAMARGLAIIATDVGAVSMMVSETNGWLIDRNIIEGLNDSIIKSITLTDNNLTQKKLNSINLVINNFTWENVINQTINKIANCIES